MRSLLSKALVYKDFHKILLGFGLVAFAYFLIMAVENQRYTFVLRHNRLKLNIFLVFLD